MRNNFRKILGQVLQRSKPNAPSSFTLSEAAQSSHKPRPLDSLRGKHDFLSIAEFVDSHGSSLERSASLKGKFTSDKKTIDVAEDVLRGAADLDEGGSNFFKQTIFTQPTHLSPEIRSVDVTLSDIADFTDLRRKYEEGKKASDGLDAMICIGGPAAENQVVLAGIIPKIRDKLYNITYITRDYKESNANHSAMQSHARHGNALNADSNLTGHALLPLILMRNLIGITSEEALDPDYRKIDVPFTIDPTKLRVYFGNEINYWQQKYREANGKLTEHDINRIESVISQEILKVIEKESGVQISSNARAAETHPSAIHVALSRRDIEETRHENEELKKIGIQVEELTSSERGSLFTEGDGVLAAWKYRGDTNLRFDAHEVSKAIAKDHKVRWIDGAEVSRIMLTQNDAGDSEVVGVVTKDNEFFYANKVHLTGGYKLNLSFDRDSYNRFHGSSSARNVLNKIEDFFAIQQPLPTDITTSTGISVNAIFKMDEKMEELTNRQLSVTNSHWTLIAKNKDYAVMRMTGGGNTGSEEYNPAYFLNLMANTRQIFGNSLVGVLSTYGCPRAINARNSTEFAEVAKGLIVSYGKGGTGITKGHYEAAQGLMILGFEKEVVEYFNKFQGRNGQPLGNEIAEIYGHVKDVEFIHDNAERTNRRMGYDKSMSMEEMIVAGMLLAALSCALAKGLKKNKKEEREEVVSNAGIRTTSVTSLTGGAIKEDGKEATVSRSKASHHVH